MQLRMDRKDAIPLTEWEKFLTTARRAGATDDTTVDEQADPYDQEQMIGYTIDIDRAGDFEGPVSVTIPAEHLHGLMFVARRVARNEGDARGLEESAQKILDTLSSYFLEPVIGQAPWLAGDEDDDRDDRDA
jgi:hypothetical protein